MQDQMINRIMTIGRTIPDVEIKIKTYKLKEICDIIVVRENKFCSKGIYITPREIKYFKTVNRLEDKSSALNYGIKEKGQTGLRILKAKNNNKINMEYLYYYLIHKIHETYKSYRDFNEDFSDLQSSESNDSSNDKIGEFIVPVPDIKIQELIIDKLDIIYNKYIVSSNKIIDELDTMSKDLNDDKLLNSLGANDLNDPIKKVLNDRIDNNILIAHHILNKNCFNEDNYNDSSEDEEDDGLDYFENMIDSEGDH